MYCPPDGDYWDVSDETALGVCVDEAFEPLARRAMQLAAGDSQFAHDLVQDTFLALVRKARSGQMDVVGMGWLMTRLRHRAIDVARSRGRESRRLRLFARADEHSGPPETVDLGLLKQLSVRERAVLVLRFVDNHSSREVAEMMGTSVSAVDSIVRRAKSKVRKERS